MNKREFLDELAYSLEGKMQGNDINEIISDYGDVFDHNAKNGKNEEETAAELGSPARIARTILEDGGRVDTDFQKNINEKTSRIMDRVTVPERGVDTGQLASMSRRLGAYVIDCLLLCVVAAGVILACLAPFFYTVRTGVAQVGVVGSQVSAVGSSVAGSSLVTGLLFGNTIIMILLFGALNLFSTIFLWATNGYSPGKWILKMRVVKSDGGKITFWDAVLRELLIKGIVNSAISGFLNVGSFLWACLTDDRKTAHDVLAKTRVIATDRESR